MFVFHFILTPLGKAWIQLFFTQLWRSIYPNSLPWVWYDTRSIFKWSKTSLISEFFFSYTGSLIKAKKPSLPYHLCIGRGRTVGFMLSTRALVQCEIQTASSRIWIRVTNSISNNDNYYNKHVSKSMADWVL